MTENDNEDIKYRVFSTPALRRQFGRGSTFKWEVTWITQSLRNDKAHGSAWTEKGARKKACRKVAELKAERAAEWGYCND